jgi:hypothetical protein
MMGLGSYKDHGKVYRSVDEGSSWKLVVENVHEMIQHEHDIDNIRGVGTCISHEIVLTTVSRVLPGLLHSERPT